MEGKVVPGKLKLKGVSVGLLQKRAQPPSKEDPEVTPAPEAPKVRSFPKRMGTGKIMTSNQAVMGKDTRFLKECRVGDEIYLINPSKLVEECRKINTVVSDTSMGISEAFSNSIGTFVTFQIRPQDQTVRVGPDGREVLEAPRDPLTLAAEAKRVKVQTLSKNLDERKLEAEWKKKGDKWCK